MNLSPIKRAVPLPVRKVVRRFINAARRELDIDWHLATEKDVDNCFRLLLNREPAAGEWETFAALTKEGGVSVEHLVGLFLSLPEFRDIQVRQHAARTKLALIELADFKIYVSTQDPLIGRSIVETKRYEPDVTAVLTRILKPGMVFVDIGANIGYLSFVAARAIGNQGKVFSFEPNQFNCNLLEMSARINGFENVIIYPFAVADTNRSVIYDDQMGNGTISDFDAERAFVAGRTIARAVSLDYILRDEVAIDVIKLDIEGAEYFALQGARELLAKRRPVIVSEFSPPQLKSVSGVSGKEYLIKISESGYQLSVIEPDGSLMTCNADEMLLCYTARGASHINIVALPYSANGEPIVL